MRPPVAGLLRPLSAVLAGLLFTLLVGCGQMVNPNPSVGGGTQGGGSSLTILVTGLPEGALPSIDVNGPDGYFQHLDGEARLSGLASGSYSVDGLSVSANGTSYTAAEPHQEVVVTGNSGAVVTLEYRSLPPIITPGTIALPSASSELSTLQKLDGVEVRDDTIVNELVFEPVPPDLMSLEVGGYIVLGESEASPYGYLGKILDLEYDGDRRLTVTASRAPIDEVVQQGSGSVHMEIGADDVLDPQPLLPGVTVLPTNSPEAQAAIAEMEDQLLAQSAQVEFLDGRTGDSSLGPQRTVGNSQPICVSLSGVELYDTDEGYVRADGTLCLSVELSVDLSYDLIKGPYAYFKASANQSGDFKVYGDGWIDFDVHLPIPFLKIPLGTISFTIGPVPIMIQPMLTFNLEAGGGIKSQFHLQVKENLSITAGARHDRYEWEAFGSNNAGVSLETAGTLEGFRVLAGAGPQLNMYFYGIYGPNIALSSYLQYEAEFDADPWWTLYLGMRPYIGVNANLSGAEGKLLEK